MVSAATAKRGIVLGRYVLYDEIAAGGMAAVHLARLVGDVGFARTVAIKRLHRHLAKDDAFRSMFLDEARLAARIRHPNVVPTLDVVTVDDELFLVMEYVHGQPLSRLVKGGKAADGETPISIASAVIVATLHGLQAAHEAKTEAGEPLGIVHRDVSPQNILVGADGVVRVLDFGIAKAVGQLHTTRDGEVKGKASYMAPEQLRARPVDPRTDVYAASVVLWEMLTGRRLFDGDSPEAIMNMVLERAVPAPSTVNPNVPGALDALVLRGLARDPRKRFDTAREMAIALESVVAPATPRAVAEWVERTAGDVLRHRAAIVADIEVDRSSAMDTSSLLSSARTVESTNTAVTTVVAPSVVARRSRSTAFTYVAFAIAAIAIAVACWSFLSFRPGPRSTDPPPTAAAVLPPRIASSLAPSPELPAPPPPSATPADGRRSPSSARPVAPVRKAPSRATARKCDPPYVIDANGDRVPRPECL